MDKANDEPETDKFPELQFINPIDNKRFDEDFKDDIQNASATKAFIKRKKMPRRKPTGFVNLLTELDETDAANQPVNFFHGHNQTKRSQEKLKTSLLASIASTIDDNCDNIKENPTDYKVMWESAKADIGKLQEEIKKLKINRGSNESGENSLLRRVIREKLGIERKFTEMQEQFKGLELLKSENNRLKDENTALIRALSKLTE